MAPPVRRRRVVRSGLVTIALLAGCAGRRDITPDDADDVEPTTSTVDGATTDPASETSDSRSNSTNSTTTTATLDLREANVTDVAVRTEGDGYVFDVTLHHDDDGEPGYADWWQIETLAGDRIGRRDLAHPHGTRPFTRSNFDPYVTDAACVVVRGHDQTHGYGGRAALVALASGRVRAVDQGPDPQSFTTADCP